MFVRKINADKFYIDKLNNGDQSAYIGLCEHDKINEVMLHAS